MVRLEGLGQLKNSVNSSGIEPATSRLVAYRVPQPQHLRFLMRNMNEQ
jgi:hypothetical protein